MDIMNQLLQQTDKVQIILPSVLTVLGIIGRWLLFRKAGKPGWHSIIPILSDYQEFNICWKGGMFFLALLLAIAGTLCLMNEGRDVLLTTAGAIAFILVLVIHWRQSMKLARSFGKGFFTGLLLFLFARLGRIVLGLGGAQYEGKA